MPTGEFDAREEEDDDGTFVGISREAAYRAARTGELPTIKTATSSRKPKQKCLTCSVPEAGEAIGIGREAAYRAARTGELPTIKIGRLLRVPLAALDRMLGGR
jgi:excisionase family DNA binding protein